MERAELLERANEIVGVENAIDVISVKLTYERRDDEVLYDFLKAELEPKSRASYELADELIDEQLEYVCTDMDIWYHMLASVDRPSIEIQPEFICILQYFNVG